MVVFLSKVLFSKKAEQQIRQLAEDASASDEKGHAATLLESTVDLINQVFFIIIITGTSTTALFFLSRAGDWYD